jgi:hypothetical protein
MGWIIISLIGFVLWAFVGHLIWVVIAYPFSQSSKKPCEKCKAMIYPDDKACRHCGWTSIPPNLEQANRICRQALLAAMQRELIDPATMQRGIEVLALLAKPPEKPAAKPSGEPTAKLPEITPEIGSHKPLEWPLDKPAATGQPRPPIVPPPRTAVPMPPQAQESSVHALDRTYDDPKPQLKLDTKQPSKKWTELLSTFMEESNIRWGEIIGGLLIVCCSTALVISFWDQIATRIWLKFSLFTGINVTTFALGLYAWHRWKLPTTSRGILVIAMMQMPLNFLAFALITLGMGWHWPTVAGEVLSMAMLGFFAFLAARILTPNSIALTTCTPVVFGLANLLVRRTVDQDASTPVLYAWGLGLIAVYAFLVALGKRPLITGAMGRYGSSLVFFALNTFGVVLSLGLLLKCSGQPMEAFRLLSPLLTLLATPALFVALEVGKRLEKPSGLLIPMILVGTSAIALSGVAILFSWPAPLLMIGTGCGLLALLAVTALSLRRAELVYPISVVLSVLVVLAWYGVQGQIDWMNRSVPKLLETLATPTTGFVWVAYSLVCLLISAVFNRLGKPALSLGLVRSAMLSGTFGTILLTAFGFGREAYSESLAAIYLVYATVAFGWSRARRVPWLETLAIAFLASAAFQWIVVGWTDFDLTTRIYACSLSLSIALLVVLMIQHAFGNAASEMQPISIASLLSILVFTLIAVTRSRSDGFNPLMSASLLWFVLAWFRCDGNFWKIAQIVGLASAFAGVIHASVTSTWWPNEPSHRLLGYAHPMFLQYAALTLFIFGLGAVLLEGLLRRNTGAFALAIAGPIKRLHDSSVARIAISTGAVLTLGVMVYGAMPGVSQEVLPRDFISETESVSFVQAGVTRERMVPELQALEVPGLPHAAASWGRDSSDYRVWGLPPIFAIWTLGLLATWTLGSRFTKIDDSSGNTRWDLFFAIAISLWYPCATLAESGVAVASALRWITTIVFLLGCLALCFWIRRIDRQNEPSATASIDRFDSLFSSLSIHTAAPWLIIGAIVFCAVLLQAQWTPWSGTVWGSTLLLALPVLVILPWYWLKESGDSSTGNSKMPIVASTLLVSPLAAWALLQIAVTVMVHPLTGPNPDTLFASLGLAGSYAVPIFLVSFGLIGVAASRPSPYLGFIAALFLLLSVLAGYMMLLKAQGIYIPSWIGLCAILSLTASIYVLAWQAFTANDLRSATALQWQGRPIAEVRKSWQTALSQISAGFALAGLGIIVLGVLTLSSFTSGFVWGALGILVAILLHFVQALQRDRSVDIGPWIAAAGAAGMGVVAPLLSSLSESLSASAVVLLVAGVAVIANSTRTDALGKKLGSPRFVLGSLLAIAVWMSFRLYFDSRPWNPVGFGERIVPVAILCGAWALSVATTWFHSDRWTWVWSLLLAQLAGFMAFSLPRLFGAQMLDAMFLQIAIAAISSAVGTLSGLGRRSRIPLILATGCLFAISAFWLLRSLNNPGNNQWMAPHSGSFAMAIAACLFGGITGFWNPRSRDEHAVIYLAGLCSTVWLLQLTGASGSVLLWLATIVLAAYCLATSFLWRSGERIQEELSGLLAGFKTPDKPRSMLIVPMNALLALGVASLGLLSQFVQGAQNFRFLSANAIMAVAFAIGLIARYASPRASATPMRVFALALGLVYAIALFWHAQPTGTTWVSRIAVTSLPLVLTACLYGLGLIKWLGGKSEWEQASLIVSPWVVALSIVVGAFTVFFEIESSYSGRSQPFDIYSTICVLVSFSISIVLCLGAAVLPGRDPFGLSEKYREVYVYGAQAILLMLVIHLRVTMPYLFGGWFQSIWPMLAVLLGFVGVGVGEWAERRGWAVLANPLRNSGSLLPLLPILAPWIAPSKVDHGVTMLASAVGYGMFGFMRSSPIYITAAIVCANLASWQLLHKRDLSFAQHPQLWVIPPALCVFAACQYFKDRLTSPQLATIRYASIGSIYVASTSEIFLQGIAKAPWLPIVLAVFSILGILFGIAARIRSMLWLGSMFLAVSMFSILWYAAVDLEQTWLWYVCGIILGAMMLFVFGLFEKRREELKKVITGIQTWEE